MDFREMAEKLFIKTEFMDSTSNAKDAIESALRAAYSQGVEDAAKKIENHPFRPCTLVCFCKANAEAARSIKPPSEK